MEAKPIFFCILRLALVLLISSFTLQPAQCSRSCETDQNFNDSSVYALHVSEDATSFRIAVVVYSKICTTDVQAVGPKWYRLEIFGSSKDLGQFQDPWEYSGALKIKEGIEFSSEEPLALFDLPSRYKWETNPFAEQPPSKFCFRLIVRDGDSCEQVVTSNCTDELQAHIMELQLSSDNGSAEEPTTAEPAAQTEEPTVDPAKLLACIQNNARLNCTGKRIKATCGSDGKWYKNTCTLRLQRCLHDLESLQRDVTNLSCTDPPPTFFVPPTPPPTMAPLLPQSCSEIREQYRSIGHPLVPTCLDERAFRPIQCWAWHDGTTRCDCANPSTGSYRFTNWSPRCNSPILRQPPSAPLQCLP